MNIWTESNFKWMLMNLVGSADDLISWLLGLMKMSKNTGREDGGWKINECFGWCVGDVGRLDKWGLETQVGGVIRLPGQIVSLSLSLSLSFSSPSNVLVLFSFACGKLWGQPSGLPHCRSMPDPVIRLSYVRLIFLFFIFPSLGLVLSTEIGSRRRGGRSEHVCRGSGGLRLARSA